MSPFDVHMRGRMHGSPARAVHGVVRPLRELAHDDRGAVCARAEHLENAVVDDRGNVGVGGQVAGRGDDGGVIIGDVDLNAAGSRDLALAVVVDAHLHQAAGSDIKNENLRSTSLHGHVGFPSLMHDFRAGDQP